MGWSKKEVDRLMYKATQRVFVQVENLNSEQIAQLIANLKTKKVETPPRDIDESDEPCAKKQKFNDKGKDVLKLVLSREGESDTFKSKFKSTLYSRIVDESSDDPSSPYSANEAELENHAQYGNGGTSEKEVSEITASINNHHNSSSVDDNLPKDADKVEQSSPNHTDGLVGKIWIRDLRSMMTETMLERFYIVFGDLGINPAGAAIVNGVPPLRPTYIKSDLSTPNEPPSTRWNLELSDVVKIYCKYFTKHVQDTIVIIANILNIISLSNKHHKFRMDESFKKRSEAEKLKERCDANRIHEKHKQVLETHLKLHFVDVVSKISADDFDCTFQMFFLSILTVLRVLDQPKFKKGSIFKNLVLLLWNSLRSCNLEHRKVFTMFRSKSFRPDCIELISLIEDSRETCPDIMDRLALFFISTMDTKDFQKVIEAVTSDTSADVLATLLEEASKNVREHSKLVEPNKRFASPMTTTTTTTTNNHATPTVPAEIPKVGNDNMVKHWVITKAPNGTYQPLAMANDYKTPRVIVSTSVDTALHAIAPLNTFYETFSNTLTNVSDVTVPVQSATKLTVAAPTSVASGTLVSGKFVAYNPKNHTVKPINATNREAATIVVGNKQYQVFRSHVRTLTTAQGKTNGIVLAQQMQKPTEGPTKCFTKNCNEVATIMCSTCTSVKYCSHNCQRVDWYENHIHKCEQLQKVKQQQSA